MWKSGYEDYTNLYSISEIEFSTSYCCRELLFWLFNSVRWRLSAFQSIIHRRDKKLLVLSSSGSLISGLVGLDPNLHLGWVENLSRDRLTPKMQCSDTHREDTMWLTRGQLMHCLEVTRQQVAIRWWFRWCFWSYSRSRAAFSADHVFMFFGYLAFGHLVFWSRYWP